MRSSARIDSRIRATTAWKGGEAGGPKRVATCQAHHLPKQRDLPAGFCPQGLVKRGIDFPADIVAFDQFGWGATRVVSQIRQELGDFRELNKVSVVIAPGLGLLAVAVKQGSHECQPDVPVDASADRSIGNGPYFKRLCSILVVNCETRVPR